MKWCVILLFLSVSRTCLLSAEAAPVITRQPVSQIGTRLGSVTFSAEASGTPPLTYQWYRDGNSWPTWNKPAITLEGLSENDVGVYTLTVTNSAGSATTEGAALSFGAPIVGRHPASHSDTFGERVVLSVEAIGKPPLKYQWKKNGANVPDGTNASLIFDPLKEADLGTYLAVVSSAIGSVTSKPAVIGRPGANNTAAETPPPSPPASATAAAPPSRSENQPSANASPAAGPPSTPAASEQMAPVTAVSGKTVTLAATSEGTPPFKFQWLKNGTPIRGATSVTLVLRKVSPTDAGIYVCIVSNSAGATRSPPFNLTVTPQ